MAREIKFRAWNPITKQMAEVLELNLAHNEVDILLPNGNVLRWFYFKHKFELLQFSGLTDKNGKNIYEGDILQRNKNNKDIMQIEFYQGMFGWWDCCEEKEFTVIAGWLDHYLEIIGNIHENPELLGDSNG